MVDEDNSVVQNCLWKDVYFVLGKFGDKVWQSGNLKKKFLPGLFTCLRQAGFGASHALYANVLKFISVFPGF